VKCKEIKYNQCSSKHGMKYKTNEGRSKDADRTKCNIYQVSNTTKLTFLAKCELIQASEVKGLVSLRGRERGAGAHGTGGGGMRLERRRGKRRGRSGRGLRLILLLVGRNQDLCLLLAEFFFFIF
jgi:hypothetical protein